MGISSALYTGVSGLNSNGQAMSVIGNNLANTNTIGYKGSRTIFSDLLSANVSGSGGSSQVGRGVGLSRVDNVFSQGTFESTESGLDLAIEGESFFLLSPEGEDSVYYSRAGAFSFDNNGYMVNPEGYRVQGVAYDANGELEGGTPTDILINNAGLVEGKATDAMTLTTNLDSSADILESTFDSTDSTTYNFSIESAEVDNITVTTYYRKIDDNEYDYYYTAEHSDGRTTSTTPARVNPAQTIEIDPTTSLPAYLSGGAFDEIPIGTDFIWVTGAGGTSTSTSPSLVDPAILTQSLKAVTKGFEFDYTDPTTFNYSASVQIYDSLGNPHLLTSYFRKTENNQWDVYYSAETDSNIILPADPNAVAKTIYFGENGQPVDDTGLDLQIAPTLTTEDLDWGNDTEVIPIVITLDNTQFNSESVVISQNQNGYEAGNFTGVSIDEEGNVITSYSNGEQTYVSSIALARFVNPLGLSMEGSNLFAETTSSGSPRIGLPGPELGSVFTNSLEQSNVDMGAQFVQMITVQRGYEANSKIITTVDDMLDTLINLKR